MSHLQGSTEVLIAEETEPIAKVELIHIVPHLILTSAIGVLIRIYTSIPNTFLPGHIYPQLIGSFFMGIISQMNLEKSLKTGLTVGFCGSITSFSTFVIKSYLFFHLNVFDAFVCIGVVAGLSFTAYRLGTHIKWSPKPFDSTIIRNSCYGLYPIITIVSILFLPLSTGLSVAVAPLGTIARYFLAPLNLKSKVFPFGTFIANFIAVLLVSVLRINENNFLNDRIGCAWIIALEYGFCGCLSTVSSFVYELDKLPVRYAYRYFCASILIGLLTCFAIVGSYKLAGNSVSSCDNNILIF